MTTKEYLEQIRKYNAIMRNKADEKRTLEEMSYLPTISYREKVQSSPVEYDGPARCIVFDEMMEKLEKEIKECAQKRDHIVKQIEDIEDTLYYEILNARYVRSKSFEEIAMDIKNSYRNTTRLHAKALKAFEEKYGQEYVA